MSSENHLGVLDEVVAVSLLNNSIDPGVELGQLLEALLNFIQSLGVRMEVSWLLGEEASTETLVGVQEDSVDVVVELSGDILGEELDLVDHVTALGSLSGGGLLGLLVVDLASLGSVSWLDLGNIEAGSEGGG